MDDEQIRAEIERLESEERALRAEEQQAAEATRRDIVARDRDRLAEIGPRLAQLWDLSRQREALRSAGGDPDDADLRSPEVIRDYLG